MLKCWDCFQQDTFYERRATTILAQLLSRMRKVIGRSNRPLSIPKGAFPITTSHLITNSWERTWFVLPSEGLKAEGLKGDRDYCWPLVKLMFSIAKFTWAISILKSRIKTRDYTYTINPNQSLQIRLHWSGLYFWRLKSIFVSRQELNFQGLVFLDCATICGIQVGVSKR